MPPKHRLSFEKDIYELEDLLAKLESSSNGHITAGEEVRRIRRELINLKRKIYSNLTPWQTIEVARHPERGGRQGRQRPRSPGADNSREARLRHPARPHAGDAGPARAQLVS